MTVLLAVHRLSPELATEARAACAAIGLLCEDWTVGIPRTTPTWLIHELEVGERRIPADVVELMRSHPTLRLLLCAREPLVKSRVALSEGRVCLLAPPHDRRALATALRTDGTGPRARAPGGGIDEGHFETLRRNYWAAWTRGTAAPNLRLAEHAGVAVGCATDVSDLTYTEQLASGGFAPDDASGPATTAPAGFIHLNAQVDTWRVHWPSACGALWLYSPARLPQLYRIDGRPRARGWITLPAHPRDQLWAVCASGALPTDLVENLTARATDGAADVMEALDEEVERERLTAAFVVEVRA